MILLRNTANQIIYTKLVNFSTGALVTNAASTFSVKISKDGATFATASYSEPVTNYKVTEVLDASSAATGIYKIQLSQAETDCNNAVVLFKSSTASYIADVVYFETSAANPSFSIASATYDFSTTGSVGSISNPSSIVSAAKSATYDGVTQDKLFQVLLSFMAGKVTITEGATPTTSVISYKKQDGSTEILSVTVSKVDGSRASTGSVSAGS
jgi:hypothetical protein